MATELQRRMRKRESSIGKIVSARDQLWHVVKAGKEDNTLFSIEIKELKRIIMLLERIDEEWVEHLPS